MKKVNVALIGAGYIADYHARGLQSQSDVEIVSVVGLPLESAKEFAKKYEIKEATSTVEDLYKREDIDAVIIGTPNKFHAPFAIDFLNNGKDVFLEKPMAMNSEEGKKVIDAAEKNNQLVMVGHMWRFDQEVDYIKDLVSSGKIGKIIKTKGYGIHENWGPEGWFTQKELAGGGALADMGVHAIDTVRYILGDPKPREVYAKIGTHYGNYDVDDSGIVIISWDNGTTSIIESGWWQPHMDGPEASTQIFGTKGYASLFPTQLKLSDKDKTEEFSLPQVNKTEHCDQTIYTSQMEHFINCIRKRQKPSPGFEEGQVVLNIVDAAYKSSESGLAVKL
jgi:predicted dehydrogenase